MTFSLEDIQSSGSDLPPRIVVIGPPKIGKTTFASQSDHPVFIPVVNEEGLDYVDAPRTPVCRSYDDAISWIRTIYKEAHDYKTCVIDSASTLEPLVNVATLNRWNQSNHKSQARSIEALGGGYGKGVKESLQEWNQLLQALSYLRNDRGMTTIIIGHAIVRQHEDPMYGTWDVWDAALERKVAALLYRWADVVLFANTKVLRTVDKSGAESRSIATGQYERCLYTQCSVTHPAGGRGRYGHLPAELPLSWKSFQEAVSSVTFGEK